MIDEEHLTPEEERGVISLLAASDMSESEEQSEYIIFTMTI